MNSRKKLVLFTIHLSMVSLLLGLTGCGDSILDSLDQNEEVMTGGAKVTTKEQAAGMFLEIQGKVHDIGAKNGAHQYQYQFSLHIDNYCGYLCLPQNFQGRQPSTYYINRDFASGPRGSFFNVSRQALPVMRGAAELDLAEIGAMANILYCYSAQELVDIHGPFPWWDYKMENQDPPLTYYSVEEIYDSIFTNLKESVQILEKFSQTTDKHQQEINGILATKDHLCGGNVGNWIKFANSLRLRMAMHISVVAPEKAKAVAKEALNSGVLEVFRDKNIEYNMAKVGLGHPLAFISNSWNDTRLNASFENLLKRLDSPLLTKWFATNKANIEDKTGTVIAPERTVIVGIRAGVSMPESSDANQYQRFSPITNAYSLHQVNLMKVSEVQFLKAEAVLRWGEEFVDGTPAEMLYNDGIIQCLAEEGISDDQIKDAYITLEAPKDIDYVDYSNPRNNAKGLIQIGVLWNDDDSREVKLEKIITQKYIANFPMSLEAWTDLRRTGFPKIYPVVDDDGDGSIPIGGIIRRMPYVIADDSDREDIATSAIPLLGGGDLQNTRIWWDTGRLFE